MTWFAQSGEDKVLRRIFREIGATNRIAVEFGAADGYRKSNTAHFREQGWTVHLFDVEPLDPMVQQADITAENINAIFTDAGIPQTFDLLSIDIDGNDLWVWKALTFQPRVVVIEYNPRWPASKSRTVPYDPTRRWDGTNYYGASVLALTRLAHEKGYDRIASTRSNLIFVQAGLVAPMRSWRVRRTSKFKRPDPANREWVVYR